VQLAGDDRLEVDATSEAGRKELGGAAEVPSAMAAIDHDDMVA
jgi:hypothetical protein